MDTDNVNTNLPAAANNPATLIAREPGIGWGDVPKRLVFEVIVMSLAKAFADLNMRDITKHDREYMVNELTDNIIRRYPGIRLSEIPDAIALGIRGEFGEYYGLSVVSIERFIKMYLLSERRLRAVKELPAPTPPPAAKPDVRTRFITARGNALTALERKRAGRDIGVMATTVYNFLNQLQLISFTADEKYDMLTEATQQLISELQLKLMTSPPYERIAHKRDIAAYRDALNGTPLDGRLHLLVVNASKKLALDACLADILMDEVDLEELINNREGLFE
ncbi:hypothetical protein [Mucilaginibacter segetis]|uniref:Uncharacterized protein n=1 Tax=Mucilaginibacter segetis TaxID=2793071 RepID=A0A934UM34_9SPHI|nr:hypothetical protein [Mucilaginibacter segetis]MBK0378610.1 hypothetical protein [Mucilaginibacter segetis]